MSEQLVQAHTRGAKAKDAFRTISEVAEELGLAQHVLRFWESKFTQVKPVKRSGNRRYYRPEDVRLLAAIQIFLHGEGYTIKGVQALFKEQGVKKAINSAFLNSDRQSAHSFNGAQMETNPVSEAENLDQTLKSAVPNKQALKSLLDELRALRQDL